MCTILPVLLHDISSLEGVLMALDSQVNSIWCFDNAFADKQTLLIKKLVVIKKLIKKLAVRLNVLVVLKRDIDASIEWTMAELKAKRKLRLKDIEKQLKAEKKQSSELFLVDEKVKAQHHRDREHLDDARCSMADAEQALAITSKAIANAKATAAELLKATEISRAQANEAGDQETIASACLLSLEEERLRIIASSPDELRAMAKEHL